MRELEHGGWAQVVTARGWITARVMVTERLRPLKVGEDTVLQGGLPFHWGMNGLTIGDSANDAFPIVLDPNVHIQEVKAATCDVRPVPGPPNAPPGGARPSPAGGPGGGRGGGGPGAAPRPRRDGGCEPA